MDERRRVTLLTIDSVVNVVLGVCLLAMPSATIDVFGLPGTRTNFYVTVLGAVLLGIGIALWIERRNQDPWRGLGLVGAIVINVLGAGTVLVWLLLDPFSMPMRGYVTLWFVTVIVLAAALVELGALLRHAR